MRPGIYGFSGEYRFLSNFYPIDLVIDGITYRSAEHYYMSCKPDNDTVRDRIISAKSPSIAKRLGRKCKLRPDWEEKYRDKSMITALRAKFENSYLNGLLLETGDLYLEETNTWGDTYWGVCDGVGLNRLGKMLMFIRKIYR
jgi:ribA/ribD-fused uncharacterized protein